MQPLQTTNKVERRSSLGDLQQRRGSFDGVMRLFRRRPSLGSSGTLGSSRVALRLEHEAQRYEARLPAGIVSIGPTDEPLTWMAQFRDAQATIRIPERYPFQGPVVELQGYKVDFCVGEQFDHDAGTRVLQARWTPAQSLADAAASAHDAVRRANLEDSGLFN